MAKKSKKNVDNVTNEITETTAIEPMQDTDIANSNPALKKSKIDDNKEYDVNGKIMKFSEIREATANNYVGLPLCKDFLYINYENGERKLSFMQWNYIYSSINTYNSLFSTLFRFSNFTFDTNIPTACVAFSKDSGKPINLIVNPNLWNSINITTKLFLLCHECLHIIFQHGIRFKGLNRELSNIAGDIVINHALIERFFFDKRKLSHWFTDPIVWVDTIFDNPYISTNKSVEYYYHLLLNKMYGFDYQTVYNIVIDDLSGLSDEEIEKLSGEVLEKIDKGSDYNDKNKIKDILNQKREQDKLNQDQKKSQGQKAGTNSATYEWDTTKPILKPTPRWDKFIKRVMNPKFLGDTIGDDWNRENFRYSAIGDPDIMMPIERDDSDIGKVKPGVSVYLDVSGSCTSLIPKFWDLVQTIPHHIFNIKLFTFDTQVNEITLTDKKIEAGGGTCFQIIASSVENTSPSPDLIFVITDGEGNNFNATNPERWKFLMPKDSYCTSYIPEKVEHFEIEDFEP